MEKMGIKEGDHEAQMEWAKKYIINAIEGNLIAKIIDDPMNKEIRDLIRAKKFVEASILVIEKLKVKKSKEKKTEEKVPVGA